MREVRALYNFKRKYIFNECKGKNIFNFIKYKINLKLYKIERNKLKIEVR